MLRHFSIGFKIAFIAVVGFVGILIYQGANYRLSLHLSEQLKQVFVDEVQKSNLLMYLV